MARRRAFDPGVRLLNSIDFAAKDLPRILLFAAAAVFVVLLSAAQRSAAKSLRSARDRLADVERELQLTLDLIPTLAWHTRPDGFAEYLNKRWLDYTGLSLHEALGWEWRKVIHPDDLAGLLAERQRMLGSGQRAEVESRMRRYDGEYRWFLFRPEPLRDVSVKSLVGTGTNTDIEDRKRAEDALRRSEAYLAEAQRLSHTVASVGRWRTVTSAGPRKPIEYLALMRRSSQPWN